MLLIDGVTLKAEFTGNFNGGYYTVPEIRALIDTVPTVDAVPLDKLCEWLDELMTAPGIDTYEVPKNHQKNRAAWKEWLTEKMEGLDDDGLD